MSRRALIAGRALAFFGITLVALNMRSAVAALSPLVSLIRDDFAMSTWVLAALGMIPPLCYGVFGMLAGRIARRWGLERALVFAVTAIALGTVARAFAGDAVQLLAWTTLLFAGIGVGNVLLPPLVKKYFPDRIGMMTTLYVTMFAIGNVIPPLLAVPVAELTDWRVSLGIWALFAASALVPWLLLMRAHRRDGVPADEHAPTAFKPWRSPMTWAILALFFCSGFNSYSLFTWMPQLLADRAGVPAATSGALLSLYASLGLPLGLVVPLLVVRFNLARLLVFSALGFYAIGYGGLLWAPTVALPLWVILSAMGTLTFAASLVLINLRTHSSAAATATSSFVQGVGYLCVALGVFGFGLVHTMSGGWEAPLWFLFICSLVLVPAAFVVGKQRFIDDGA
ncbi:MAG: CynX/NimT family MFS transporter [Microbacteriaceae bacterium]